jgi:cytoskeletal protein RodZ
LFMKSVGQQLQEARLAKNGTPELAARETKIKVDRVRDLEADDYTHFSSPAYARGFVRTYARALGLDEYKILRQLDNKLPEDDNASFANDTGMPYVPEPSQTMHVSSAPRTGLYVVLGLFCAVVIIISFVLLQAYRAGELPRYFASTASTDNAPGLPTTNSAAIPDAEAPAHALPVDPNDTTHSVRALPVDTTAVAAAPADTNAAPPANALAVADAQPPMAAPAATSVTTNAPAVADSQPPVATPVASPVVANAPAVADTQPPVAAPAVTSVATSTPAVAAPAVNPVATNAPTVADTQPPVAAPAVAPVTASAPATDAAPVAVALNSAVPAPPVTPPVADNAPAPGSPPATIIPSTPAPADSSATAPINPPAMTDVPAATNTAPVTIPVAAPATALPAPVASAEPEPAPVTTSESSKMSSPVEKAPPRALPVSATELAADEASTQAPIPTPPPATTDGNTTMVDLGASAANPPPAAKRLVLTASRDSFVRVTSLDGGRDGVLFASVLRQGQSLAFDGHKFSVNVGVPSAVDIMLDGVNYGPHSDGESPETFTLESHQP